MLALKPLLQQHGISQAELARAVNLSPAAIAQLVNKEIWPANPPKDTLQASLTAELAARGIEVTASIFEPVLLMAETEKQTEHPLDEDRDMLLRKQSLAPQTRKHFNLFRDPFDHDVQSADDVFTTPAIRYVREYLWQAAKFGGSFVAIVSESGAGKSTLRRDLNDRIVREEAPIKVIEPYVLGMEDNDKKGKTLKASNIADAIIGALAPLETPRAGMEAKSRQMHRLLKDSSRSGWSHCVIIEEAHALSIPTLKHLKRFLELEDGFKKLLSIVLVAQSELKLKLAAGNANVREVAQRCELIELAPLDANLDEYLRFKFKRVGVALDDVFEPNALDGIRSRLIFSKQGQAETHSLMYPLMVNNLVVASMNNAAALGFAKVSADLVKDAR
jgi:type II secretory pathway predicted ATPase ExeA/predicted XRE-type DNA-binding protein